MNDLVLQERAGAVLRLTLNRPERRNALSQAMMGALHDGLEAAEVDSGVRAVVIAANGPAFCAGHDLKEMRANPNDAFQKALFSQCSALMQRIQSLRPPVIAEIHAMATAAGCQLAATCDLAVAATGAKFATPGVKIGLFCSTPMVALTRAIPRKHAMRMLLTGDAIDAEEALALGLISHMAAPEALRETVDALAASIAEKSGAAQAIGKAAFYRQAEMTTTDAYAFAAETMVRNMLEVRDAAEGVDAFLERREPEWSHS